MSEPPIAAKPLDSDASSLASTVDPDSRRSSIGQLTSGELRAFVLTERRTMQEREVYFREEVRAARERAEAARVRAEAAEAALRRTCCAIA